MPRLLKIQEASEYIGLSANEIRRRVLEGTFPAKNISRGFKKVYRFDIRELDRWIDELPEE